MKRIATTAGVLALGAASMHGIYAPELSRIETGKPWTVAASLRGFYDDNWACQPDNAPGQQESWGFEARPYIGLNLPMGQTYFGLSYLNSSRWYEARSTQDRDPWDFSHKVDLKFSHQFTPRYRLRVNDSFLYTVEPDVYTGGIVTVPYRSDLSYVRNLGDINFTGELTRQLGVSLSYANTYYNYDDSDSVPGSYSARLDRLEHRIPIDLRWQVQPDLVGLLGYQFSAFDYIADGTIGDGIPSSSRNAQAHAVYVGGDYDITAQLRASLRAGAQYVSYDDYSSQDDWMPYVDFSLGYFYTVGSHVDVGFKHTVAATDVATVQDGVPTLSQEVSSAYVAVTHQFTPKLSANLTLQYQWANFHGGFYDDVSDNFLLLSVYGSYKFNQFLSFEAGYHYDWLDSDLLIDGVEVRSYNRNYVYLGLRAQY